MKTRLADRADIKTVYRFNVCEAIGPGEESLVSFVDCSGAACRGGRKNTAGMLTINHKSEKHLPKHAFFCYTAKR